MAEIMKDTQRFLHFNLTHTGTGEDNHYVDLGRLLSEANRRSYRQGMVYHVANIVFDDAQGDADIDVCTAPNNWTTQEAWRVGFRSWLAQQRAAIDSVNADLGKWSDFKVGLNSDALTDVDQATLIDVNGNTFAQGSWDLSHYVIEGHDDVDIVLMGANAGSYPNYTRVGLLTQLEMALQTVDKDPEFNRSDYDETIWTLLSTDQTDDEQLQEVLEDIVAENELPPYDKSKVLGAFSAGSGRPSSPWVARTCMIKGGASTASPVAAVGGFAAPCGLLMIETNSSVDGNSIGCTIELVPGEYKGVHAYPMRGGGI